MPKATGDDAVTEVRDAIEHKDPHAEEMPLQSVLRPFANHDGIGKAQKAKQDVVVVNLPAAADHDEDRERIDPMHDAHWPWMQAAWCGRFGGFELDCRRLHRLLPRSFNLWLNSGRLFFDNRSDGLDDHRSHLESITAIFDVMPFRNPFEISVDRPDITIRILMDQQPH